MPSTRQRYNEVYELIADEGVENKIATGDTNGAPSDAELEAEFGAADSKQPGWMAVWNDSHAGGVMYLIVSNGTKYAVFTGADAV